MRGWRGSPRRNLAKAGLPRCGCWKAAPPRGSDAGLPTAKDREALADTPDDCWRRPYDPYAGEGARERYLRWEIDLVHQIEREGDLGFRVPA